MLYVLDTDRLGLYEKNHSIAIARSQQTQIPLTTTAIKVEEQLRGRLAQVSEAKDGIARSLVYQRLVETVLLLSDFRILPYDAESDSRYQALKTQRFRVGTQDLRIASITLAHDGILLTKNLRDFEKIPGLKIQNWSS